MDEPSSPASARALLRSVLVEFPMTPTGASRFRLQVQAGHQPEEAWIINRSITEARAYLSTAFGSDLV